MKIDHTGFCLDSYDEKKCHDCPTETECLELYQAELWIANLLYAGAKLFETKAEQSAPTLYLMCPYSSRNEAERVLRYWEANRAAAYLMRKGFIVFSPISHSHPISLEIGNGLDGDFWLNQDRRFVEMADCGIVLCINGWKKSKGIKTECGWFEELGKPVLKLYPTNDGVYSTFRP